MSQCCIHANLVKVHTPVHEILCKQESVTLTQTPTLTLTPTGSAPKTICPPPFQWGTKFGSLSPAVTLKIRSRSPKHNQLFNTPQCYIHANLVKIHTLIHEISCKQERVTLTQTQTPTLTPMPTPTGSAPKTICLPPLQ